MTRALLAEILEMMEGRSPMDSKAIANAIKNELAKPEQPDPLQTVRAAFRAAGLADGGVESFDDVGPELLWQVMEIRAKRTHTEAEVQEIMRCETGEPLESLIRRILGVPAP
jgi:hypothetical protein